MSPLKTILVRPFDRLRALMKRRSKASLPISSQHELVIALALVFLLGGLGSLFVRYTRPATVVDLVPHAIALFWLFDLIIGGAALLASIVVSVVIEDPVTALIIEWPALAYIGGGALAYGLCLLTQGTAVAFFATVTYLILGTMCLTRSARVAIYLRNRRAETTEERNAE